MRETIEITHEGHWWCFWCCFLRQATYFCDSSWHYILHCGLVGLAWRVEQGSYHILILSCSFTAHQMEISLDSEILDFGPKFIWFWVVSSSSPSSVSTISVKILIGQMRRCNFWNVWSLNWSCHILKPLLRSPFSFISWARGIWIESSGGMWESVRTGFCPGSAERLLNFFFCSLSSHKRRLKS